MAGIPPMEHHEQHFAPPLTPTAYPAPAQPTSWPKVLGIICIVFGGLGILGGVWGILSPVFNEWLASLMPPQQQAAMEEAAKVNPYPVATSLFMLAIAALLLAGGIGLVRCHGHAIGLLRGWAVIKIFWVIVGTFVGLHMTRELMEEMQKQTGSGPVPGMEAIMTAGFVFGVVVGILWGCALPVFVLIWFSRRKIRNEVASWA
ncbi:MAG: hypothetical protein JXB13_14135 [Phycisphaerae bacterium]|nr:hypothetical protein [Phycisphaerae bacterium]